LNKVDALIAKLCPRGVPTYALGDIGETVSGLRGKSKSDFSDGNCPFVSYVDISNNPALNFEVQKLVKVKEGEKQNEIRLGDVLITGSSETKEDVGLTSVVTVEPKMKTYINSFCFIWRPFNEPALLPDFSKHLFRGREFRDKVIGTANGVTRQNISKPKLLAIKIPVPPIEVQKEIVLTLDKFAEIEAELAIELEAELKARRQQYEYYRNQLLTFKELESQ
jgi:type I restriction enzyme S subunit